VAIHNQHEPNAAEDWFKEFLVQSTFCGSWLGDFVEQKKQVPSGNLT